AALRRQLPRGLGVNLQLFGNRVEPRFVIRTHASAHARGRRAACGIDTRDPRLILTPLFEQALNHRGVLGRSLGHRLGVTPAFWGVSALVVTLRLKDKS